MTETVSKSIGETGTGNDVSTLHPLKVMAFLFLTSFSSLFSTLPLTKVSSFSNNKKMSLLTF